MDKTFGPGGVRFREVPLYDVCTMVTLVTNFLARIVLYMYYPRVDIAKCFLWTNFHQAPLPLIISTLAENLGALLIWQTCDYSSL